MDAADLRERLVASLPEPPGPDWAAIERALAVEEEEAVRATGVVADARSSGRPVLRPWAADGHPEAEVALRVVGRPVRRARLRLSAQALAVCVVLAAAVIVVLSTRPSERHRPSSVALGVPAPGSLPGQLWFSDAACRLRAYSFATGATVTPTVAPRIRACLVDSASPDGRFLVFRPSLNEGDWVVDVDSGAILRGATSAGAATVASSQLPVVTDDGEVASCTGGGLRIVAFGRPPRSVPGCFAAVAGGRLIVLDPETGVIRDVASGRAVLAANPRYVGTSGLAGSRDGLYAILGAGRNGVDLYGLDGRRRLASAAVVPSAGVGARLADGGATLAVLPPDAMDWQIMRLADGATLDRVDGYPIEDVAFAPGGRTAAVLTGRGIVLVDASTLRPVAALDVPATTLQWTP